MKYVFPIIDGTARYDLWVVDFEQDYDERRPTPKEMEWINFLAKREEQMHMKIEEAGK